MSFHIIRQDITQMKVDAIVNAANEQLAFGGGVCGAIFKAAGVAAMQEACRRFAPIGIGEAVVTPGFNLKAKYVIHTVGPVYRDGHQCERAYLKACYLNSLQRAVDHKCESIAFPLISSGIYGYPKSEAIQVAMEAIKEFLDNNDLNVYLAIFDREALKVSEVLLGEIDQYIDDHFVELEIFPASSISSSYSSTKSEVVLKEYHSDLQSLDSFLEKLDEPFSHTLLRLIDSKGMTDVEVYKRANMDRKLFSKIRSGKSYMPSKRTIIALAIAMSLTLEETADLLGRAGYALSCNSTFDLIIEYFVRKQQYNIFEINEVLFKYDQPLLGG